MKKFFSVEPYRIFFPIGAVFSLFGVGHWFAYGLGWIPKYSGHFHAAWQIELFMGSFILGFLMTAVPKFSNSFEASFQEILIALVIFSLIAASLEFQNFELNYLFFGVLLLFLLMFIGRRFLAKAKSSRPGVALAPPQFVWIPFAILSGLIGSILMSVSLWGRIGASYAVIGRLLAEQGFVLSIVLGVGSFLGPRLMGSISTGSIKQNLILALLFHVSFWLEGYGHYLAGNLLRTAVAFIQLISSQALLFKLPNIRSLFTFSIFLSFWLLALGFLGGIVHPEYRVAVLHVVFLGGVSLLTFTVATMVVLSHSGHNQELSKPLWIFKVLLVGLIASLIVRSAANFIPEHFFIMLAASSSIWFMSVISWIFFAWPYLIKKDLSWNSQHERFKQERNVHC